MKKIALFYVTHASKEDALEFVRSLTEDKHIACGNVLPIDSCYWWEGQMEQETEYVSIVKTTLAKADGLRAIMRDIHPYDTPCFLHWEVTANETYANWIEENVR